MPLYALTDADEITAAYQRFAERLQNGATPYESGVGWQGGGGDFTVFWQPNGAIWGFHEAPTDCYWFGFGTDNLADGDRVGNVVVQFGFVLSGESRRRAGIFARDSQDGSLHLLHSGGIHSPRAGINKATFLAAYNDPMAEVIWPSGVTAHYCTLGSLEAPDLMARIGVFTQTVQTFKNSVANGVASGI
jgi:hypothetical protein